MFHVTNSIFFGSSAAVFAFNRISRSLRFLLCKELLVPSSVFYDDFPLFSPEESADEADERASELLDLLGWRHAKTGPKAPSFQPDFVVLGMNLDLVSVPEGVVTLSNKQGRVDRLCRSLMEISGRGSVRLNPCTDCSGTPVAILQDASSCKPVRTSSGGAWKNRQTRNTSGVCATEPLPCLERENLGPSRSI